MTAVAAHVQEALATHVGARITEADAVEVDLVEAAELPQEGGDGLALLLGDVAEIGARLRD
jgi:hypothetical protein